MITANRRGQTFMSLSEIWTKVLEPTWSRPTPQTERPLGPAPTLYVRIVSVRSYIFNAVFIRLIAFTHHFALKFSNRCITWTATNNLRQDLWTPNNVKWTSLLLTAVSSTTDDNICVRVDGLFGNVVHVAHVDGARLCLLTATTNRPIVYPLGDIWARKATAEWNRQEKTPDSSTRALCQFY
jgi:hypothetical protein